VGRADCLTDLTFPTSTSMVDFPEFEWKDDLNAAFMARNVFRHCTRRDAREIHMW
jgi:hypothetical protein